ncbi:serine protease easter-like isoform X2 [Contarinia nasturtii]|nr:serine protease easter-like isoform X2 [Contarinia nasturtii]XP_031619832.1 serine protease easter-like isoform X2 [Contarinia nasturtii]
MPGECGSQLQERIVGGEESSIFEYPWFALIEYTKTGESPRFICGGTLIHKDYVITAAHCINEPKLVQSGWKIKSVRLGEHDLRTDIDCDDDEVCAPPVVNVDILETFVHEAYDPNSPTQYNDIALMRLSHSVEFTDFVRPICLPFSPTVRVENFDGIHLSVCGFGGTENGTSSDVKLKVEINGFNWDRCNNLYGRQLVTTQICAGGEHGKDSCSGDSGGPLMRDSKLMSTLPITYLVGIVSRGPQACGKKDYPAIYTRVDKFLSWIRYQIKL